MSNTPNPFRRFILNAAQPLLKTIGTLSLPTTRRLSYEQKDEMIAILKPGDVILSHSRLQATNLLIPGFWKHAAIHIGHGQIVEAITPKIVHRPLASWWGDKDFAAIYRPLFAAPDEARLAAGVARTLEGLPYDTFVTYDHVRSKNKQFYCSEVIWWSYNQVFLAAGRKSPFTPRLTLGAETITPQDFANAKEKWAPVWFSKETPMDERA